MRNSCSILAFIFVSSCINPGVDIKDSPSLGQSKKPVCEYKLNMTENQAKEMIVCQNGYKFVLPKPGIDRNCVVRIYNVDLKKKYSLFCKDFNNEKYISIY